LPSGPLGENRYITPATARCAHFLRAFTAKRTVLLKTIDGLDSRQANVRGRACLMTLRFLLHFIAARRHGGAI
jgi:hypothetical protein